MSPSCLKDILRNKSLLGKRSLEKQESFIGQKKQKIMNGTLMNFLIDASNRGSVIQPNTA
jgi:hypothetical protein